MNAPLTDQGRAAVIANMGLCGHTARRYLRAGDLSFEDLLQEAALGLCEAVSRSGGSQLPSTTAVFGHINHQLGEAVRGRAALGISRRDQLAAQALRKALRAESPPGSSPKDDHVPGDAREPETALWLRPSIPDPRATPHDEAEQRDEIRRCYRLLREIPSTEREVMMRRFGIGRPAMTISEVADAMSLRPLQVRLIEDDALRSLRRAAEKSEGLG